jgi:hypothetical protein
MPAHIHDAEPNSLAEGILRLGLASLARKDFLHKESTKAAKKAGRIISKVSPN